jgi:hypothetical protein
MNRKLIRLTESDLHRIVKESVNQILTELDWKTYQNAAKKAHLKALDDYGGSIGGGEYDHDKYNDYLSRSRRFRKAAEDAFNKEHGYDDGRFHLGLDSDMEGSRLPSPSGKIYPYNDTSKIKVRDKREGNLNFDDDFYRRFIPKNVKDKYDIANQELQNYKRGNYEYQKGKGWQ